MTTEQIARWNCPLRKPFRFFQTVDEELSVDRNFWRNHTPQERLEYLEFTRCVIYGEEVVNAKMIRCYRWRKQNEEAGPENIVYF